ncbi:MAG: ArnT family glycosyltransferase [Isosphaeraceae bacterium]
MSSHVNPGRFRRIVGPSFLVVLITAVWADHVLGWFEVVFDFVAHLFYEVPMLARVRRPSQVPLARAHLLALGVGVAITLLLRPGLTSHRSRWAWIFLLGYALRATVWVAGGNVPLVPGDSSHYVEVATSVYRGEGAVKHYVESFFLDYPRIREGKGVLDDWATPLYAYVLAGAYWITGVVPLQSLDQTFAVAKGVSFLASLAALPAIYLLGRRRFDPEIGLIAMALLAILPVHVIYAGFALRESLVALTSIVAVWALTEVWATRSVKAAWGWAVVAGTLGGLAVLGRNTAMALLAGAGLFGLARHGGRRLGPLLAWGVVVVAVIAPWAWVTHAEYGQPFFSYTNYFQYNFSWTVHHYEKGNTEASQFYQWANASEIVRVKVKALAIIVVTSTMILSVPLTALFLRRVRSGTETDRLVGLIGIVFALATLVNVADVTQVAQLGRYYLPVFALALPSAAAGLRDALGAFGATARAWRWVALTLAATLWADPTWAYDAGWLVKPYQLHWPALSDAGDWVKAHPEAVPHDARIMTWFPWELRIASDRTTVLMPRNFNPTRIDEEIRQYGVTHVLWGSFENPPHVEPEVWGPYLDRLRIGLGLTESKELHRSPPGRFYPVRLYRIR